jgi:hypothetical protein
MSKVVKDEHVPNTNLASEFYVISMLHRKGIDASLTLGNKKAVDIIIADKKGRIITIDVKGLQGTTNFPIENWKRKESFSNICFV